MLSKVGQSGSFAAAARALGLVPSTLTYRVRQMEEALDVLLFDRNSRQARLTAAGTELLREGKRVLEDMESIANRVKRIATGWESEFTVAVDSVIDKITILELCEAFYALSPPTKLKLREETLNGTLEALHIGRADLAIGVTGYVQTVPSIERLHLGQIQFVFAVAPNHALAKIAAKSGPLSDAVIKMHRAVAIADSALNTQGQSHNLLNGQDVFTVPSLQTKLDAQLRGLGVGFLPEPLARPYLSTGRLVQCAVQRLTRPVQLDYAWRASSGASSTHPVSMGKSMQWWLTQLQSAVTRASLLCHPQREVPSNEPFAKHLKGELT